MKPGRINSLKTIVRRNGGRYRWMVMDALGEMLERGHARNMALARAAAELAKQSLVINHPGLSKASHKCKPFGEHSWKKNPS